MQIQDCPHDPIKLCRRIVCSRFLQIDPLFVYRYLSPLCAFACSSREAKAIFRQRLAGPANQNGSFLGWMEQTETDSAQKKIKIPRARTVFLRNKIYLAKESIHVAAAVGGRHGVHLDTCRGRRLLLATVVVVVVLGLLLLSKLLLVVLLLASILLASVLLLAVVLLTVLLAILLLTTILLLLTNGHKQGAKRGEAWSICD